MIKKIHSTLLLCKDIKQTTQFYKQIGFLVQTADDGIRIMFDDYRLAFVDENISKIKVDSKTKKGVGMFIFFEVENVDSFYQTLKEKNIATSEMENRQGGKRRFTVKDPDGYKLIFFTQTKNQ